MRFAKKIANIDWYIIQRRWRETTILLNDIQSMAFLQDLVRQMIDKSFTVEIISQEKTKS